MRERVSVLYAQSVVVGISQTCATLSLGLVSVVGSAVCVTCPSGNTWSHKPGPELKRENPLDLSILLSGGKETNKDGPSNGE